MSHVTMSYDGEQYYKSVDEVKGNSTSIFYANQSEFERAKSLKAEFRSN